MRCNGPTQLDPKGDRLAGSSHEERVAVYGELRRRVQGAADETTDRAGKTHRYYQSVSSQSIVVTIRVGGDSRSGDHISLLVAEAKGGQLDQRGDRHEVTTKRVRYEPPGVEKVVIRNRIEYASPDDEVHTLDVYYSPDHAGTTTPAVVLVSGLSDISAQKLLRCRINEMESFISWARLAAASGLVGVTYTTATDPVADLRAVLAFLRAQGAALAIDGTRLGLWAASSHVPNLLGQLIEQPRSLTCAVLCYGFMLDLHGSTGVAEAQRTWRFVNPAAGKTVDDLSADVPLFIARAGRETNPHLNDSIDRFLWHALRRNLPVTFVNHHVGPHAFDVEDDGETSRAIVRQILTFLRSKLLDEGNGVRTA